ncbi:MAG: ABC transporter permease [Thermomonas sp.]
MLHDPHARQPVGFVAMVGSPLRNRHLILSLVQRDVAGRYRGSWAGLAWSFFNPLLMLAVYSFVFSVVFKSRWNSAQAIPVQNFALVLFAGIIVHGILAECMQRAPMLVLANPSYVKRVIFPLEVLPWVTLLSALFHAAISLLVLVCAQLVLGQRVPPTIFLLPLVLLPFALLSLGITWILAAIGVYIRDVAHFTGILSTALLFLAPVMYPVAALPEPLRPWIYLNPISFIVEQVRDVLMFGVLPDWAGLGVYSAVSVLVAWLGFWCFQRARKGFADVV